MGEGKGGMIWENGIEICIVEEDFIINMNPGKQGLFLVLFHGIVR